MHFLCYFSKFNIIFVILYIIFGSEPKQKRQIIQKKNPSHHEGFLLSAFSILILRINHLLSPAKIRHAITPPSDLQSHQLYTEGPKPSDSPCGRR